MPSDGASLSSADKLTSVVSQLGLHVVLILPLKVGTLNAKKQQQQIGQ